MAARGEERLYRAGVGAGEGRPTHPDQTAVSPRWLARSLRQVPIPGPSNLDDVVADRWAAVQMGKALFWDMQVGSDGITACATCHYHAGADNRSFNQLSPGLLRVAGDGWPDPDGGFDLVEEPRAVRPDDFPLHKLRNPDDLGSEVLWSRNDVLGSQGVFRRQWLGLSPIGEEVTMPLRDGVYHTGGLNLRRVSPRNAPSVINAVFNLRNFWDGRAQDVFNGVNPFGKRDWFARVYVSEGGEPAQSVALALDHASLASQAMASPLSTFGMSAGGRTFPDLGRRLLAQRPLARQRVHEEDSVLGNLAREGLPGLAVPDYATLVRVAFQPRWWDSERELKLPESGEEAAIVAGDSSAPLAWLMGPVDQPPREGLTYTQMEANFSLFFGLALQLYESTLVSDRTPYDRFVEGEGTALSLEQRRGFDLFFGKAGCARCHSGAEFSDASVTQAGWQSIRRVISGAGRPVVQDHGFHNTGVRPWRDDPGLGSCDPYGLPLSESQLLGRYGGWFLEQVVGSGPSVRLQEGERTMGRGAFKTPGLRNVALTAPYFHNGGQRTLREVVQFYNRGGDFSRQAGEDLALGIQPLRLTATEQEALVQFLEALTDERVRLRQAPFDHPQLFIPNGAGGDVFLTLDSGLGEGLEQVMELPATGRRGGRPLRNFLE